MLPNGSVAAESTAASCYSLMLMMAVVMTICNAVASRVRNKDHDGGPRYDVDSGGFRGIHL